MCTPYNHLHAKKLLLLCIILLCTSCYVKQIPPMTSLQKDNLKGSVQTITMDTLIHKDSGFKTIDKVTYNKAGMKIHHYALQRNRYNDTWDAEFHYTYDSSNNLLSVKGPNYTGRFEYNAKGLCTLSIDDDFDGTCTTFYFFDKSNNLVKDSTYYSAHTYHYEKNSLVRTDEYDPRDGDSATYSPKTYYRRDKENRILEEWEGGNKQFDGILYAYDSLGRMISKVEREDAEIPFGKGRFDLKETWKYNKHNDIITISHYRDNSRKVSKSWNYQYDYDSLGNWISKYYLPPNDSVRLMYKRTITYFDSTGSNQ